MEQRVNPARENVRLHLPSTTLLLATEDRLTRWPTTKAFHRLYCTRVLAMRSCNACFFSENPAIM